MPRDDGTLSSLSSASASRRNDRSPSRKCKANDKCDGGTIRETMREMITLMSNSEKSPAKRSRDDDEVRITSDSIDALYKLYDKHMNHLNFLKDNDLLSGNRKTEVMANIDEVYDKICSVSGTKRVRDDGDESTIDSNSNSNVR